MATTQVALSYPSGTNVFNETALGATALSIKASAGTLYYVYVDNSLNAAQVEYVKLYDTAGVVTVGTTAPDWIIRVAGAAVVNYPIPGGVAFAAGLQAACVTGAGTAGTTAPTSSVTARVVYS